MKKKKSKRSPRRYQVTFWRAVGEFKNGVRRMMQVENVGYSSWANLDQARKKTCAAYRAPLVAFASRARRAPKKIIEIQVFEDGYSTE